MCISMTTKKPSSKSESRETGTLLPCSYQPSPYTVIVGHGQEPKMNLGNQRLRLIAQSFLQSYQNGDKACKTQIVSHIISMIQKVNGAFVKHGKNGRWYKLDKGVSAREKVSYVFRDLLADQYKSSSKSKVARRQHQTSLAMQRSISPTKATTVMDTQQDDQQQEIVGKATAAAGGQHWFAETTTRTPFSSSATSYYHQFERQTSFDPPSTISLEEVTDIVNKSGAFQGVTTGSINAATSVPCFEMNTRASTTVNFLLDEREVYFDKISRTPSRIQELSPLEDQVSDAMIGLRAFLDKKGEGIQQQTLDWPSQENNATMGFLFSEDIEFDYESLLCMPLLPE